MRVMNTIQFWLASSSPRRRQILSWTGIPFNTLSADIDETQLNDESAEEYVIRLASGKAAAVTPRVSPRDVIIAADTTVAQQESILGKPATAGEAVQMLKDLRGKTHQVITALCVSQNGTHEFKVERCISSVTMRQYSDEEIEEYVQTGDPLDKAGAYAIQHSGFNPTVNFRGCYASVMGMPLCHLERTLRCIKGYEGRDMAQICQNNLEYTCPIHTLVFSGEEVG